LDTSRPSHLLRLGGPGELVQHLHKKSEDFVAEMWLATKSGNKKGWPFADQPLLMMPNSEGNDCRFRLKSWSSYVATGTTDQQYADSW